MLIVLVRVQGDCVAVLLNILRQMTDSHYNHYISQFTMATDLEDFLMEIMMLFHNLIQVNWFLLNAPDSRVFYHWAKSPH